MSSRRDRRPTAVDLFAGAGGLSLGFEQAGFDVVMAVEYDPIHAAVHEYNFPETKVVCTDASKLARDDFLDAVSDAMRSHGTRNWDGKIDCVIGGPPCQAVSTAGHRRVDDERNDLMFHFARLVGDLKPRYVVMENVPGLLMGEHKTRIFDEVVARLARAGYATAPARTLNAADFGVPQDRDRVFLIGWSADAATPVSYPEPTHAPVPKKPGLAARGTPGGLPPGPSVRDAIGDIPDLDAYEALLDSDETVVEGHAPTSAYARRLNDPWFDPTDLSTPRAWDQFKLTSSNRTTHEPRCAERFAATKQGEVEPVSRFYRLHWDGLSCTLRAGTGRERGAFNAPRPIHPERPRVISVREAMRLHGYPDWFRMHVTKWHGFRQTGNSVPPPLAKAVARQVVEALGLRPRRRHDKIELGGTSLLAMDMTQATSHFGVDPMAVPGARRRVATK